MRPSVPLELVSILLLWAAPLLVQGNNNTVFVTNGTDLVRELQEVFSTGSSKTLILQNNITMDGVPYTMLDSTIDSGSVFINSTSASTPLVVDLAMRSPAVASLDGAAKMYWTNLVFVNGCSMPVYWDANGTYVVINSSPHYFFAERRSQTDEAMGNINVTAYVTQGEVYSIVYWLVVTQTPFAEIKAVPVVRAAVERFNGTKVLVRSITPYSVSFASALRPPYRDQSFTLRSTSDPSNPAPFRLPTVLPSGGTARRHTFCNGTLLTSEQQAANMTMTPLWITRDSEGLQGALVAAANYTSNKKNNDPPPVIFLSGNTTMGGENGQFPAVTMRAECMLHGPFNHDPAAQNLVTLSLGNRANTVQLALLSKLYMSHLVIKDLLAAPLGNLAQDPLGDDYVTALPLWGINIASRVNVQVLLDTCALVVPPDDYMALLSAAIRGPQWKSGAQKTRPLINLIQTFQVDPDVPFDRKSLTLTAYSASGVLGNDIIFVPSTPIPNDAVLPDLPEPPPPPPSSGKSSSNVAVAAGVGAGVGGGLLLAVILGVMLWVRSRHAAAAAEAQAAHYAELGKAKALAGVLGEGGQNGTPPGSHPQIGSKSSSGGPQSASTTDGRQRIMGAGPINVAALHAAVRANQAAAASSGLGTGSPMQSSNSGVLDPRKAVAAAAGAMGAQDADKLTLLGVLGRGTWGTVYRGLWRNLDVAVKTVLFSDRTDGKGSLPHERAIMEAAVCTSVAHRNVVSTFHYDIKPVQAVEGGDGLQVAMADDSEALMVTEWKLYLVQEWCNTTLGEALRQSLLHAKDAGQAPQMDLLLTLLGDVVSGVDYLHSKNIIHGDLKPDNVMLKMDSGAPIGVVAKITDFGLSTTLGPQATHVSNYNSGTPFYVAPEVLSEGRATKASDIYSFGVLLWEVFNCSPPWIKGKDGAYKPNPLFPHFPPTAPKRFATLTQRCMMRDWRQRPTLAEVAMEVRTMHEAWLDGYDSLEIPAPAAAPAPAEAAMTATGMEVADNGSEAAQPAAATNGGGMGAAQGGESSQPAKRGRVAVVVGEGARALSEFVGARTPDQQIMEG